MNWSRAEEMMEGRQQARGIGGGIQTGPRRALVECSEQHRDDRCVGKGENKT